ncbi:MAG TPA: TonB-dependent siderophore receptor [Methylosinus sp.]|uniref:TonB-dependent siderophore receptor n=1 Tax=Methylosinus sp. TaxID=427 RepID=UPI002F934221
MLRSILLRGASAGALTALSFSHSALAQEPLPAIEIGAATGPARPTTQSTRADSEKTSYHPESATTALKTNASIIETPVSVQIVPQQVLLDQQATTLARAVDNVSGVRSYDSTYVGGNDQFQIRGFSTSFVYIDGLRLQGGLPGTSSLVNIDRVEILKGPASILYGRADPGGIVNIVTKKPQSTPHYIVQQQFGSWDSYRTTVDTTGPLTRDETLLYRVTAEADNAHSFRQNDVSRYYFISPVVQWNIDAATRLTINLQYNHQVIPFDAGTIAYTKYDPLSRIFGEGPVSFLPRGRTFNDPNSGSRVDTLKYGYDWSHNFSENWTLTNRLEGVLNHGTTFLVVPYAFDAVNPSQLNRIAIGNNGPLDMVSANLDLTGKVDTFGIGHSLLVGADFLSNRSLGTFFGGSKIQQPNLDYNFPVYTFTPTNVAFYNNWNPGKLFVFRENWFGFYVQDHIRLPYDIFLLAGARYDRGLNHTNAFDGNGETLGNNSQRVTPRVGLLWKPIAELSVYGSYMENYGAGGGTSGPVGQQQILPSESARQWEFGVKTNFFDKRFTATLALYDLTKQNVATSDPDPMRAAAGYRVATGEARSKGIELDVAGEILPGWKVIGGYSYIDSLVTKDNGVVSDPFGNIVSVSGFKGLSLPDVSRHMGNLWTTYEFQSGDWKGLKFGGGANARSKAYADSINSFHVPGYAIVNVLAAYSWDVDGKKLTAQLNVDNLADTRYYPTGFRGPLQVNVGTPRTFKGSIRVEF